MSSKEPNEFKFLINEDAFKLAGMSKFDENSKLTGIDEKINELKLYVKYLKEQGITTVISIEETGHEATKEAVLGMGLTWCSCFLNDWTAPCVNQLKEYCQLVKKHKLVATHCWGGTGRTGVFLASYLLFAGKVKNAQSALKTVRTVYNQHSVEMKAQYNALGRFSDSLGLENSMAFDNTAFKPFEAEGHWHVSHGDDGITKDPGHKGHEGYRYKKRLENINRYFTNACGSFRHSRHIDPFIKEYEGDYDSESSDEGEPLPVDLGGGEHGLDLGDDAHLMSVDLARRGSSGVEDANDNIEYHLQGMIDAFSRQARKTERLEEKVNSLTASNRPRKPHVGTTVGKSRGGPVVSDPNKIIWT